MNGVMVVWSNVGRVCEGVYESANDEMLGLEDSARHSHPALPATCGFCHERTGDGCGGDRQLHHDSDLHESSEGLPECLLHGLLSLRR